MNSFTKIDMRPIIDFVTASSNVAACNDNNA